MLAAIKGLDRKAIKIPEGPKKIESLAAGDPNVGRALFSFVHQVIGLELVEKHGLFGYAKTTFPLQLGCHSRGRLTP